jgi:Ca2+-binding EF-hand superfamily protein
MSREKSETELYCEIKEAFQIFDRDNDGIITKDEEQTILRMFGIVTKEEKEKDTTKEKKEEKKEKEENENEEKEENENEEKEENENEENNNNNNETTENKNEEQTKDEKETVEFNEFFDNIRHKIKEAQNDDEILAEIDAGTPVNIRELEHDMQISKEHISNDLIQKLLKDANPNGGNYIIYKDFVKLMLNK